MHTIFDQVKTYWKLTEVGYNAGLDYQSSEGLSTQSGHLLPTGLCALLSGVNGMTAQTEYDLNGFRFYPLKEIYLLQGSDFFVFADYLHECWLYGANNEGIHLIYSGIENAKLIAPTVDSFLSLYLNDNQQIYPPSSVTDLAPTN